MKTHGSRLFVTNRGILSISYTIRIDLTPIYDSNMAPLDLQANTDGIDWTLVAEKLSDISTAKFSPDECRIKWLGDLHPSIDHSDWTDEETSRLRPILEAAREQHQRNNPSGALSFDWVSIGRQLGVSYLEVFPHSPMLTCLRRTGLLWTSWLMPSLVRSTPSMVPLTKPCSLPSQSTATITGPRSLSTSLPTSHHHSA